MDAEQLKLYAFLTEVYENIKRQQEGLYAAQSVAFATAEALKETLPAFAAAYDEKFGEYMRQTSLAQHQAILAIDEIIQQLKAGRI